RESRWSVPTSTSRPIPQTRTSPASRCSSPSSSSSRRDSLRFVEREVRYAKNGDVHVAYTVVGDGPIDLVYTTGIFSNLDVMWEEPRWARYLDRLASFTRLIVFDMRGIGLSDRGPEPPFLELQMDDVRAVMEAAGSETAAVMGVARGGSMTMLFAATYPERVRALVLYAPSVKTVRADDWPRRRT